MATTNPRIYVSFQEKHAHILNDLARSEKRSLSSVVRDLAIEALELKEDFYLAELAADLDNKECKLYSHEEAWEK